MSDNIVYLNAVGKPFADRDAAEIKARRLTEELGEPYGVESTEDGFIVTLQGAAAEPSPRPAAMGDTAPPPPEPAPAAPVRILRPAWRSFYAEWILIAAGLLYLANETAILSWLYYHYLEAAPRLFYLLRDWVGLAALGLIAGAGLRMFWIWLGHRYLIWPDRIETRKYIIFQQTETVALSRILSTEVHWNILDRLLRVGRIELGTAATAQNEISMPRVSRPLKVLKLLTERTYAEPRPPGLAVNA
ncbi:MAG TPA: PH domain-containing protein [Thiohalobacter sp.]|nr:PH domain-containing protein [Thiohalobacter sp.]